MIKKQTSKWLGFLLKAASSWCAWWNKFGTDLYARYVALVIWAAGSQIMALHVALLVGSDVDLLAGLWFWVNLAFLGSAGLFVWGLVLFFRCRLQKRRTFAWCALVTMFAFTQTNFNVKGKLGISKDGSRVVLRGSINYGMDDRLVNLLAARGCLRGGEKCPTMLDVNSGGGDIWMADVMLEVLRSANIRKIKVAGKCESACASVLFSGLPDRAMAKGATLGFHSSWSGKLFGALDTAEKNMASNTLLKTRMKDLGLPEACVDEMLSGSLMMKLTAADLVSLQHDATVDQSKATGGRVSPLVCEHDDVLRIKKETDIEKLFGERKPSDSVYCKPKSQTVVTSCTW